MKMKKFLPVLLFLITFSPLRAKDQTDRIFFSSAGINAPLVRPAGQLSTSLELTVSKSLIDNVIFNLSENDILLRKGPAVNIGTGLGLFLVNELTWMAQSIFDFQYGFKPQWAWGFMGRFTWTSVDYYDYLNDANEFIFPVGEWFYTVGFNIPMLNAVEFRLDSIKSLGLGEEISFRGKYRHNEKLWSEFGLVLPVHFHFIHELGVTFGPALDLRTGFQFSEKSSFYFDMGVGYELGYFSYNIETFPRTFRDLIVMEHLYRQSLEFGFNIDRSESHSVSPYVAYFHDLVFAGDSVTYLWDIRVGVEFEFRWLSRQKVRRSSAIIDPFV